MSLVQIPTINGRVQCKAEKSFAFPLYRQHLRNTPACAPKFRPPGQCGEFTCSLGARAIINKRSSI